MDLVRQAVAGGGAAVVVSSELDELSGFCDRIYVLRDGEVRHVVDGSTSVSELARCARSAPPVPGRNGHRTDGPTRTDRPSTGTRRPREHAR